MKNQLTKFLRGILHLGRLWEKMPFKFDVHMTIINVVYLHSTYRSLT